MCDLFSPIQLLVDSLMSYILMHVPRPGPPVCKVAFRELKGSYQKKERLAANHYDLIQDPKP